MSATGFTRARQNDKRKETADAFFCALGRRLGDERDKDGRKVVAMAAELRALMPTRKEVKAPEGLLILSDGATTGDGEMDENPMRLNREGGLGDNYKNYGKDIRV